MDIISHDTVSAARSLPGLGALSAGLARVGWMCRWARRFEMGRRNEVKCQECCAQITTNFTLGTQPKHPRRSS